MRKVYIIKKMTEDEITWDKVLEHAEKAEISCFPWDENGYMPKTEARVVYTEKGFYVYLISYEKEIRAEYVKMNDPVCKDSCMEFFFNPNPEKDERYMNFELNPLGTLYLGIGKDRFDSKKVTDAAVAGIPGLFDIKPYAAGEVSQDSPEPFWSIQFFIPFSFIEKLYGNLDFISGMRMTGNFYKCGDDTRYPHYGCWNKVINEEPDFHRSESFGTLILE